MSTLNKMTVIGYVGSDPENRTTKSDTSVANFSVATSESWKDGDEWKEETTWHDVVAWAGWADWVSDKVKKGTYIRVEGPLKKETYKDKKGVERSSYYIKATHIQRMGSNSSGGDSEEE